MRKLFIDYLYMATRIFCVIMILNFNSCKNETKNNIENYDINIDIDFSANEITDLNSLFSDINFKILDSKNEDAFFDRFDELIVSDGYLYIHEVSYDLDDNILVFSDNGKFLKKYAGSSHRGPGSFATASDILVDAMQNTIEVFDRLTKKIVIFHNDSEVFSEIFTNVNDVDAFEKMNGRYYLYLNSASHSYNIYIVDEKGKIRNKLFKSQKAFSVIHGKPDIFYFDPQNNEVLYKHMFGDTLYSITADDKVFIKRIYNNANGLSDSYLALRIKKLYDIKEFHKASRVISDIKRDSTLACGGQWRISNNLTLTIFGYKEHVAWLMMGDDGIKYNMLSFNQRENIDFLKYLLVPRFADKEFIYTLVDSDEFLSNYNYLLKHEPDALNSIQKKSPEKYQKYKDCISKITDNSNAIFIKAKLNSKSL